MSSLVRVFCIVVLLLCGGVIAVQFSHDLIDNGSTITEWENGLRTDRVIATRYANATIGYTIGFTFPKNPNDADRAEISDFMDVHDGSIFQGGGAPGAEVYVKFKDVTDKDSATKKIRDIIGPLSQLITDLGSNSKVTIPGLDKLRAAEKTSRETMTRTLTEKAKALIPFVQDEQPKLLEKFQKDLATDKAGWKFECQRKGDYLAITITRAMVSATPDGWAMQPRVTVLAVALTDKPNINLIPGTPPDMNGHAEFFESDVHYKGDKDWTSVLRFPGITLPREDNVIKEEDAWSMGSSTNGIPNDGLGVIVGGIARPASDDKIVIGEGGGSRWEDMMSVGGSFTYLSSDEAALKVKRSGVTINIPYGLGSIVYQQIMDAIEQGVAVKNNL